MATRKPARFGEVGGLWSDLAEEVKFVRKEDLLDVDLLVLDAKPIEGRFGRYISILVERKDTAEKVAVNTGSGPILDKVLKAKQNNWLPLPGKLVHVKRYYDII